MRTLDLRFGEESVEWSVTGGGVPRLPVSTWPGEVVRDLQRSPQWHAVSDAWTRGWVTESALGFFSLPYEHFYDVDSELRNELGLPAPEPVQVELASRGSVADEGFRIDVEVRAASGERLSGVYRWVGPLYVRDETGAVSLPASVCKLIGASQKAPRSQAGPSEKLRYLAEVKELAVESHATLDPYLSNEDVALGDDIGFDVVVEGPSEIEIQPVARDSAGHEILIGGAAEGKSPPTVSRRDGQRRSRVVLTPESRENADKILSRGKLRDADVPRFLTNPEAYLPDGVDLAQYGDRVKSIDVKVYNSRPYLHVKRNAGGWLEGAIEVETEPATGDDPLDRTRATTAKEGPTLSSETYQRLGAEATEDGWARDGENWVQIDQRHREFVGQIQDAGFDLSRQGYQRIDGVLQIFENIELLEYVVAEEAIRSELSGPQWVFPETPMPETFCGTLLDHQRYGYRWLSGLYDAGLGGLLADEMGLGKTVQILAHLAKLYESGRLRPALLVVPLTLMENWERELRTFVKADVKLHRHEGMKATRLRGLRAEPDIVITSYDTLRRDQLELARYDWTVVVCDEAQYIKNPTAQRTSVVKALKANQRLALTGTPVENGLVEFWCIIDYVQPGRLGSWADFRETFERPIVDATADEERRGLVDKLQSELQPHYLRRHKDEVLEGLPIKHPSDRRFVALGSGQLNEYRDIVVAAKAGGRGAALGAIQRLLQVCARPPASLLCEPASVQLEACPKLSTTLDILAAVRDRGEKVVVFTRFLELQAMLQRVISEKFGLFPDCINGSLPGNRQRVIDVFSEKDGFNVIVLSHDVAGIGLNVTAANHVVHYTRPWNPAKENQATDRLHRIGQVKPVHVYLPMVTDDHFVTVEQRLNELLAAKETLARDVLVPKKDWAVSEEELLGCVESVELP